MIDMKEEYLLIAVAIIGYLVLFFFPEPQTNFLLYAGTALFFTALILFLIFRQIKNKK